MTSSLMTSSAVCSTSLSRRLPQRRIPSTARCRVVVTASGVAGTEKVSWFAAMERLPK
ncbi:hypothetical protein ACFV6E_10450 [Streptomyces sp. NPDC059785]|uniref:hypothetical protein n=1 Tax=Streptomyces sp. NPDC059785 TaxID=3346945 RepID=UPI003656F29C